MHAVIYKILLHARDALSECPHHALPKQKCLASRQFK